MAVTGNQKIKIGIAAPIEIATLKAFLPNLTSEELKLGLGGTAVNVLIEGFLNNGHHVTVFTLDSTVPDKVILEGPQLKIIIGKFRTSWKSKILDFEYKEFEQIKRFILDEKDNIDIVNAHWSYEFAIGTILAGVPHIITFRDHALSILKLLKHPYRIMRLCMDRWVKIKGDNFSYNSVYLKTLIGLKGEAIPNPVREKDISVSRNFPDTSSIRKICFIANGWDYRKNPEAALEAFHILIKEFDNVELHLFGNGFEPTGIKYEEICRNGLNKKVYFRGGLKHHQLMEEITHFDIMLHTAREESFGNNLIEAMAKGIPIIAGKNSGAIPWVLNYGTSGSLTDIENPMQIAQELKKLLTDKEYYETLSKNGIKNLQERFLQDKVCELYVKEYTKIINSKSKI